MVWRAARPAMGSSGACEDAPGFELGVGAFAGGRAAGRERGWRHCTRRAYSVPVRDTDRLAGTGVAVIGHHDQARGGELG